MSTLSLLSWNINKKDGVWEYIVSSGVDVALLQEAKFPPVAIKEKLTLDMDEPWENPGRFGRAAVAGVSDRVEFMPLKIKALDFVNDQALRISRPATLSAARVRVKATDEEIIVASLYSYWEGSHETTSPKHIYADASVHRLISDLSALLSWSKKIKMIVAGDLNVLYGYSEDEERGQAARDYWERRYDTVFQRMEALGFEFLGPQAPEGGRQADPWPKELPTESKNVPTFYHNKQTPETATRQLDFVFATNNIASRIKVRAANRPDEWGPSDHCRVFIEME